MQESCLKIEEGDTSLKTLYRCNRNIKISVAEIALEILDWVRLPQDGKEMTERLTGTNIQIL